MITSWQATLPDGKSSEELLLSFDQGRASRVLILSAWFDEANKMRRFTVETMRALDQAGIDSFLPDLPGCNESLVPLQGQTIASWREQARQAAAQCSATHVLAIRAGAMIAPDMLPGCQYAAQTGAKLLRGMIRARIITQREAGYEETSDALLERGRSEGLVLAGYPLSAEMIAQLEHAEPTGSLHHKAILPKDLGGAGLWLRAEPDEDAEQVRALATMIATGMNGNDESTS
ncbi:MAG: hypothetical protein AAF697_01580 [Pseudomonadota bacterium]